MSAESLEWLNRNTLIGFTDRRGNAWHYRASDQGEEPNHYPGPVPPEDLVRRLFHWTPIEGDVWCEYKYDGDTYMVAAEQKKAIVRPDTAKVLGIVSPSYTIHDYRSWLLNNVVSLIGGEIGIGSAGLLQGGAKAWVQVEVPDTFRAGEDIEFRPFLTAATSLDGSMSTTYLTGATVVVCDNTLRVALSDAGDNRVRIRHSLRSQLRVEDAKQALDLLEATQLAFEKQVGRQLEISVTEEAWQRFLKVHFPLKDEGRFRRHPVFDNRKALDELWRSDDRVAPWQGTGYGVIAAVNTYEHHVAQGRSDKSRAERNAHRAVTGDFDSLDERTWQQLQSVLSAT